jgi:hypothetical protein
MPLSTNKGFDVNGLESSFLSPKLWVDPLQLSEALQTVRLRLFNQIIPDQRLEEK